MWSNFKVTLLAQQPIDLLPFRFTSILSGELTLKIQGQGHSQGQT